jgi:hypothetical protein
MQDAGSRKPSLDDSIHPLPVRSVASARRVLEEDVIAVGDLDEVVPASTRLGVAEVRPRHGGVCG